MIPLAMEVPTDSTYRLYYSGKIGVSGTQVQQAFSTEKLPPYVRATKSFRDDWRIFLKPRNSQIANLSISVDFADDNSAFILTFDSANPNAEVDVEAWFVPSLVR